MSTLVSDPFFPRSLPKIPLKQASDPPARAAKRVIRMSLFPP